MSLINDVLKDLEKRQSAQPMPRQMPATPEVRSASGVRFAWWLGIAVVAGVALHWGLSGQSPEPTSTATMQATMPELRTQPEPVVLTATDQADSVDPVESASGDAASPQAETSMTTATAEQPAETVESSPDAAESQPAPEPEPVAQPATTPEDPREDPVAAAPDPKPEVAPPAPSRSDSTAKPPQRASGSPGITIQRAGEESVPDAAEELDTARRELARHQYQSASRRIRSLLEREPGHDPARLLLANSLIRRGEGRTAVNLLDAGLGHSDDPAELARLLGRVLIDRGETARAREVLAAHAPEPLDDPDYHQLLAAAHRQAGDHEAALESYRELSGIVPGRGAVWIGLGASLEALDQPGEAREAYVRALEADDPRAARFARQRLNAINSADRGR